MNDNKLDKENFNISSMQPIQIPDELEEREITSVSEIKIEEEQSNVINKNLPHSEKHPKLTMIFLFIFFLIMFIYIMAMPYIDEWLNGAKDNGNQSVSKVESTESIDNKNNNGGVKLSTLTCSLKVGIVDNYTQEIEQSFKYNKNNEILSSTITKQWDFNDKDDNYVAYSKQCNENFNLIGNDGISVSCIIDEFQVITSIEFDLELFKPIVLENETINSNSSYKQNINEIKNKLLNEGYICE